MILNGIIFNEIDKKLAGPIVYIFHTEDTILYIGSSKQGLARTVYRGHRMAPLLDIPVIKISIAYCDTEAEARKLESDLISQCKPMLNKKPKNPWIDISHLNRKRNYKVENF